MRAWTRWRRWCRPIHLTARLLRLVNTAAHGSRPVVAINEAVLRLGMVAVRQLAMSFSWSTNTLRAV